MKLINSKPGNPTRAEQTRQKRIETSQRRITRVKHNVVQPVRHPVQSPPVTVRGGSMGVPLHQKSRGNVRRQFYYSLGATGAEIRIPAMPSINPDWRIFSAIFVLILLGSVMFVYNSPKFKVDSIKFTGLQRLKAADIQEGISLKNMPIFTVNPKEVQQKIEKNFPELANVKVSVGLPALVAVSVTERVPVIAWKYKDKLYWVDKNGFIFLPHSTVGGLLTIESDEAPPVIMKDIPPTAEVKPASSSNSTQVSDPTGANPAPDPKDLAGENLDPTVLKAAFGLKKIIPSGTTLAYTSKNGLGWSDPQGWNVYVGFDLDDIDLKLKMYQAVVQKLNKAEIKPVMISVENLHAPFYRLEP